MTASPSVALPTYDRRALATGIVHFGVGGFHRAHQAAYLDDLAEQRISSDWGVTGVVLRRRGMPAALAPQRCLYTLVERGPAGDTARVVASIRRCIFGPDDPEAVLAALTRPATRAVTLTITGDGYGERERVAGGRAPTTVFDYLTEALARRRRAGLAPFTVLSCDNLPENGRATRAALLRCAGEHDELLARWISDNVAFPSSVVDRITPQTTDATAEYVAREFGILDRSPVVAEPYTQWVVEDEFCNERPPLDEVGVQFVSDVGPYELVKKRLLNGAHCALAYVGYLAGHRRTDEVLADPVYHRYLGTLLADEISPLLSPAGLCLSEYSDTVLERFANARVADPLSRLCARGSTKMPAYLLPSLDDAVARYGRHELLTLAVAGWFHYLRGTDRRGARIEIQDPRRAELEPLAREAGTDPRPLLAELAGFERLRHNDAFVQNLELMMRRLDRDGARATVAAALAPDLARAA